MPAPAPAPAGAPAADTGRLFRSQGVSGHDEAVLALSSDHFGRLRTLDRQKDGTPASVLVDAGPVEATHDGDHGVDVPPVSPYPAAAAGEAAVAGSSRGRRRRQATDQAGSSHRSRQITGGAVYIVVIGVTLLVGFANALIADGDIGWPTGLALLVSSVYAALTVRRDDDIVAIIVPPIAFLAAALTAGQLFLGTSAGSRAQPRGRDLLHPR